METSKVPEKLYGCYKGNGNFFMDYRPFPNDESIEYTRTDAFIEKACEWLEPVLKNYAGYYVGKDILGDFRKYMKEE